MSKKQAKLCKPPAPVVKQPEVKLSTKIILAKASVFEFIEAQAALQKKINQYEELKGKKIQELNALRAQLQKEQDNNLKDGYIQKGK